MVKLKNLSIRIGDQWILQNAELHVYPGECMALLAPPHSGKTTLLRSIAGLEPLDEGEIWLDDRLASIPGRRMKPHARSVSMVFQVPALWPHMTVRRHLEFAAGRCKKMIRQMRVAYLLEKTGLVRVENRFPHQLSLEDRQRLELGRALARQPRVLLLDEPLSRLDNPARRKWLLDMTRIIKDFFVTTIYASRHWREAVFFADRVAVLEGGRIGQVEFADHYCPPSVSSLENSRTADRFTTRGKVIHMDFRRGERGNGGRS